MRDVCDVRGFVRVTFPRLRSTQYVDLVHRLRTYFTDCLERVRGKHRPQRRAWLGLGLGLGLGC